MISGISSETVKIKNENPRWTTKRRIQPGYARYKLDMVYKGILKALGPSGASLGVIILSLPGGGWCGKTYPVVPGSQRVRWAAQECEWCWVAGAKGLPGSGG